MLPNRAEAERRRRPIRYLGASGVRKDELARDILREHPVSEGLVCVLTCLEPCDTYRIRGNRESKRLELRRERTKCLHVYKYWLDGQFGLMGARLQTWLPYGVQVWINGREWLARRLDRRGIAYRRQTTVSLGSKTSTLPETDEADARPSLDSLVGPGSGAVVSRLSTAVERAGGVLDGVPDGMGDRRLFRWRLYVRPARGLGGRQGLLSGGGEVPGAPRVGGHLGYPPAVARFCRSRRWLIGRLSGRGSRGRSPGLKRAFRLVRCFFRGFRSFSAAVGLGVFCHNLIVLAEHDSG